MAQAGGSFELYTQFENLSRCSPDPPPAPQQLEDSSTLASHLVGAGKSAHQPLGARTLLGAPGLTTSNKKLLGAKGIATRSKDAISFWPLHWIFLKCNPRDASSWEIQVPPVQPVEPPAVPQPAPEASAAPPTSQPRESPGTKKG